MIGYLTGKLISAKPTQVTLDVNGVGYIVNITINTFDKINGRQSVSLFIHTSVREDSITLYGFHSESEKQMFETLISVNGIGPKLAQSILSGIIVDDLISAIQNNDVARIIAIPGVGRKTAERMMVELRGKVGSIFPADDSNISVKIRVEAVAALSTLGYNPRIAEKTIREIISMVPSADLETVIKKALSQLTR